MWTNTLTNIQGRKAIAAMAFAFLSISPSSEADEADNFRDARAGAGRSYYCKCKSGTKINAHAYSYRVSLHALPGGGEIDPDYISSEFPGHIDTVDKCTRRVALRHNDIYDLELCIVLREPSR